MNTPSDVTGDVAIQSNKELIETPLKGELVEKEQHDTTEATNEAIGIWDPGEDARLQEIAAAIQEKTVSLAAHILVLGRLFTEAHDRFAERGCHGRWSSWCDVNTKYSTRTADRYRRVWARFGSLPKEKRDTVSRLFRTNAMYQLSSDEIPDEIVQKLIDRATATGEEITGKEAKQAIAAYKKEHELEKPHVPSVRFNVEIGKVTVTGTDDVEEVKKALNAALKQVREKNI